MRIFVVDVIVVVLSIVMHIIFLRWSFSCLFVLEAVILIVVIEMLVSVRFLCFWLVFSVLCCKSFLFCVEVLSSYC